MNTTLVRTLSRTKLKMMKYAPALTLGGGIVMVGMSMALMCRATLRIDPVLKEHASMLERIKTGRAETSEEEYSKHDYQHDISLAYAKTALGLVKQYVVPTAFGVAGVSLIIWSHHILQARNTALMAAYTVLNDRFQKYRERIASDHGQTYEQEVYHNERKVIEKTKVKDEDGKTHTEMVERREYDGYLSQYSTTFEAATSALFKRGYPDGNRFTLECVCSSVNNLFHARGHLFLNDVLRQLGMEDTPAGAVVGWIDDGDDVKNITFGVQHDGVISPLEVEGPDGDTIFVLDFNVDGIIYDLI